MARRARGSLYRQSRRGKAEDVWTIQYTVAGRRLRERAFRDKAASEQLLAQRLREAARDAVGLGDPYRAHRARPLTDHVEDFLAGVSSRHRTERHKKLMRSRLLRAFAGMGARSISDLDLSAAEVWLGRQIDPKQGGTWSIKTRDHYANALRQWGEWMLDVDRMPRNPFHRLKAVSKFESDARRIRLALTAEQVWLLVQAAEQRPVQRYRETHPMAGEETMQRMSWRGRRRGLLYLFVALTGLRAAECRGIRWADLELGADAWVKPRASTTKAKRKDVVPLDPELARRLEEFRREVAKRTGRLPGPKDLVFEVPLHIAALVREDAAWAGVPTEDHDGRRLDFHALRATYATLVARAGVSMQTARRLIRHTDPKLTARHYEKLDSEDLRRGGDLLSESFWRQAVGAQVGATAANSGEQPRTTANNGGQDRQKATS